MPRLLSTDSTARIEERRVGQAANPEPGACSLTSLTLYRQIREKARYDQSNLYWAGKIFLLAGAVTLSLSSLANAQCCNSASAGIEYGMPMMMGAVDPADELIEPDDPTKWST